MRKTLVVLVPIAVVVLSFVAVSERRAMVRAGYRVADLESRVRRRRDRTEILEAVVCRMCSPELLAARAGELGLTADAAVAVVHIATLRKVEGSLAAAGPVEGGLRAVAGTR